jgi:hypothetical protein
VILFAADTGDKESIFEKTSFERKCLWATCPAPQNSCHSNF